MAVPRGDDGQAALGSRQVLSRGQIGPGLGRNPGYKKGSREYLDDDGQKEERKRQQQQHLPRVVRRLFGSLPISHRTSSHAIAAWKSSTFAGLSPAIRGSDHSMANGRKWGEENRDRDKYRGKGGTWYWPEQRGDSTDGGQYRWP